MPLPRYTGGGIQPVAGGSVSSQQQARLYGTFADRIDNFQAGVIKQESSKAITEGTRQGKLDIQSGIRQVEDDYTLYGRAYNQSATASYQANVAMDMKNQAAMLAEQFKYDPERFRAAFDSYGKTTINKIEGDDFKLATGIEFKKYGDAAYAGMVTETIQKNREDEKISLAAYSKQLSEDYMSMATARNEAGAANVLTNLTSLLNSAVMQGHITDGEAYAFSRTLQKDAYRNIVMTDFNDALANGEGVDFLREFDTRKETAVNQEEKDKITANMITQIKSYNSIYKEKKAADDAENKIIWDETELMFISEWRNGTLSEETIGNALDDGDISMPIYKKWMETISDPGPLYSNEHTLYQAERYLTDYTEAEIDAMTDLTFEARSKLIADRRTKLKTTAKWTTTVDGYEAVNRVKRHFNIQEGTLMASIDFNNDTMRAFDGVYRKFHDRIQALSADQREPMAKIIADEEISRYEATEEAKADRLSEKRKTKLNEAAVDKANVYNSSYFGQFMEVFGTEPRTKEYYLKGAP